MASTLSASMGNDHTVGRHDHQGGAQAVPHRKGRIRVERLLNRRQRVELVADRQLQGLLVLLQGGTAVGRGGTAAGVGEHETSGRVKDGRNCKERP